MALEERVCVKCGTTLLIPHTGLGLVCLMCMSKESAKAQARLEDTFKIEGNKSMTSMDALETLYAYARELCDGHARLADERAHVDAAAKLLREKLGAYASIVARVLLTEKV